MQDLKVVTKVETGVFILEFDSIPPVYDILSSPAILISTTKYCLKPLAQPPVTSADGVCVTRVYMHLFMCLWQR